MIGLKIESIPVIESFKFLGLTISCDRKTILGDAKKSCSKFVAAVRGKIRSQNEHVEQLLFGACYRSCLIFYLTPYRASGII